MADLYLTNEAFLYRVVGVVATPDGELVELEDCFRLDVVRVPLADVRARRLRAVTPAAAGTEPAAPIPAGHGASRAAPRR